MGRLERRIKRENKEGKRVANRSKDLL